MDIGYCGATLSKHHFFSVHLFIAINTPLLTPSRLRDNKGSISGIDGLYWFRIGYQVFDAPFLKGPKI